MAKKQVPQPTIVALLHGPDKPGLVAGVSNWIFDRGGNIIHADQHRDGLEGVFFQRLEWSHPTADKDEHAAEFRAYAEGLGMKVTTTLSLEKPRVAIMVSKIDHCFHDIMLRWKSGEFPCDMVGVLSNHDTLAGATASYGLPYYHIPLNTGGKPQAEREQVSILLEKKVDLIILARYMQFLSADFLNAVNCPIINIHHSFLPAFAGARPYHQAYTRGVKLIGATAHYTTDKLDEGPIIQQAVDQVNHRHNVQDLIRKGRDLEKIVFSQAVRRHLESRILVYNNKTVVFD